MEKVLQVMIPMKVEGLNSVELLLRVGTWGILVEDEYPSWSARGYPRIFGAADQRQLEFPSDDN